MDAFSFDNIDPRPKLLFVFIMILLSILIQALDLLLILMIFLISISLISNERKDWLNYLSPFKFLLPFIFILNTFFYASGTTFWSYSIFQLTSGGVYTSFFILVRLFTIAGSAALYAISTSSEEFELTLVKLHVPWKLAFIFSLTLKLVPDMKAKFKKIEESHKARGVDIEGNPIKRVKTRIPMLIPFMSSIVRYGYELADALEVRNFNTITKRTHYLKLEYKKRDYVIYLLSIIILILFLLSSILYQEGIFIFAHIYEVCCRFF